MFGFTTVEIHRLAYDIATQNNLSHPFNDENKMAGKDWLAGFLKRHPQISTRNPEPTSTSECECVGGTLLHSIWQTRTYFMPYTSKSTTVSTTLQYRFGM